LKKPSPAERDSVVRDRSATDFVEDVLFVHDWLTRVEAILSERRVVSAENAAARANAGILRCAQNDKQ
jgi:hypothetical protein